MSQQSAIKTSANAISKRMARLERELEAERGLLDLLQRQCTHPKRRPTGECPDCGDLRGPNDPELVPEELKLEE